MEIKINGKSTEVYTPYNKAFVSAIKSSIGGARWDGVKKCWVIPTESVEACRRIMVECYGESDVTPEATKFTVTFKIDDDAERSPVTVFGRSLATAYGRDSGAKLGSGFELVDGEIGSGGSISHWTSWAKGTFVAHGITQALIDKEASVDHDEFEIMDVKEEHEKTRAERLIEEKERLLKRIAEIDEALKADNASRVIAWSGA